VEKSKKLILMALPRKKIKGRSFAVLANDGEDEKTLNSQIEALKKTQTDDMVQCSFENYHG
jgi:hypothetical protein